MSIDEYTPEIRPNPNQTDILLCAMPALYVDRPPGAPAILQATAEQLGYTAKSIDLSIEFFVNQCNSSVQKYEELACIFRPSEPASSESQIAVSKWLEHALKIIEEINPKIIGISVFTHWQHRSTKILATAIRKKFPHIKIIVGGYGLQVSANTLSADPDVKKIDQLIMFHQYIKKHNLADYIVLDNPIEQFADILFKEFNETKADVSKWKIVDEKVIYNTPIPNYDDYKLDLYIWNQEYALPINGSLGCVRNCTFCNVQGLFGKFKFRTGEDIAAEMIHHHKKYGIKIFEFTDSLINGSLKAFREWLTIIAEYNDPLPEDQKIRWFGQYICRPAAQVPDDLYDLMSRSGVINLIVGVESGSNEILEAMRKKMTVEDVFCELEKFEEYDIKMHVLILSGFYNETWERYIENLRFIIKCQPWVAKGIITKLSVGLPLFITDNSPLFMEAEQLGLIIDQHDMFNWKSVYDESNDFIERARRRLVTQVLLDRLKIPMCATGISFMHQILGLLKKREDELKEQLACIEN